MDIGIVKWGCLVFACAALVYLAIILYGAWWFLL